MILITGSKGQLGYDFQKILKNRGIDFIATDYDELDITDVEEVRRFVLDKNIEIIINCAAYNDVDRAEIDSENCYKLNSFAPKNLAKIAKEIGADFVTYSTDFVFDGEKTIPYSEDDIVNPLSIYGKSKSIGEKLVQEEYNRVYIIRTSWVFGIGNNNFIKQIIKWSKDRNSLRIVDDQVSSPTYSYDLAYYSLKLIESGKYGLYHMSNDGECSKYEQAKYILKKIGWKGVLEKASTDEFKLKAKRAKYIKIGSDKLEKTIGEKLPHWKDGIDRFLTEFEER